MAVTPTTRITRLFFWQLGVTLFVLGFSVFVLSEKTDTYFAWTIKPSLTAACLGANYWGSMVLVFLCARERAWAVARVTVPGIFVAGTLLLLATFLHIDRFAMDTVRGWIWVILYAVLPPAVVALVVIQLRTPGGDPPRITPLARVERAVMLGQAAVLIGLGGALFIAPGGTASLWPWKLTDLTARGVGAWMLAIGTTTVASTRENDWSRLFAPMLGYTTIAVLQLIALARYLHTPDWHGVSAWIYAAFLASMLMVGLYGTARSRASRGSESTLVAR